jgi:hypothetical protein
MCRTTAGAGATDEGGTLHCGHTHELGRLAPVLRVQKCAVVQHARVKVVELCGRDPRGLCRGGTDTAVAEGGECEDGDGIGTVSML